MIPKKKWVPKKTTPPVISKVQPTNQQVTTAPTWSVPRRVTRPTSSVAASVPIANNFAFLPRDNVFEELETTTCEIVNGDTERGGDPILFGSL